MPISRESCSMIESDAEADTRWRLFGDRHLDPAVDEPLPYDLTSSMPLHQPLSCDTQVWKVDADVKIA